VLEATSQLIQVLKQRGPEKAVDIDDAAQRVALEVTLQFPIQLTHEKDWMSNLCLQEPQILHFLSNASNCGHQMTLLQCNATLHLRIGPLALSWWIIDDTLHR
jgi:hypothetical protein